MPSLSPTRSAWCALALAALSSLGCSGDNSPKSAAAIGGPTLSGVVLDYTDTLARGVPVEVSGTSAKSQTIIDGRIVLPNTSGARLLRVGDSVSTPTLLVPYTSAQSGTFLTRPIFIPRLGTGISGTLPSSVASVTTISGEELAGVSLRLAAGTSVSNNSRGEVEVLGVSASRLPVALRGGSSNQAEPRAAFMVEPHGVTFTPPATLTIPRLDPLASGPFDIHRIDPSTGTWTRVQSGVSPVNGGRDLQIQVEVGTLYCAVPQGTSATVAVTGRVVSGGTPVEGYRAECWNRTSDPTGADGTFTIPDVPTSFGAYLVRVYPARPGSTHLPEVVLSPSTNPTLGDISVAARPPDRLQPQVRATSPTKDQANVSRSAQIVVTFSEAIDPTQTKPYKVVGPKGEVSGSYGFDSAFAVRFRPSARLDPSDRYTILVDTKVQDLAGNFLDDDAISFAFTTQGGAPDPPATDSLAFGIAPLSAASGQSLQIPGRNYTGGTTVSFAGFNGVVQSETADLITVTVPGTAPAGNTTISLQAGSLAVPSLQPLVLDLRGSVARILSGTNNDAPLVALERASPPAQVIVDGTNLGGTGVTLDGVGVAAVDSTILVGGQSVTKGRTLSIATPVPATFLSGPVVVRGSNANPGAAYRFLLVREE